MDKRFLIAGSFFGLITIIIGAFGAHALQSVLDQSQLNTFETGVKYQMYHALLLMFLGLFNVEKSRSKTVIFWLLVIGTVFFSWSIFGLATNSLTGFNFKTIAILTPVGGTLLIISWALIFYKALTLKNQ
jgi:uncharacterized membrane protein YgdD (TMEM256/DUF423 family)